MLSSVVSKSNQENLSQSNFDSLSITLTHLMPAPFVQQVGRALFEAGLLNQFATTLVDRPDALWLKSLCKLAKLANYDLSKQLTRRAVTELPSHCVKDYPFPEIVRLLVARIDKDKRLTDRVFNWETSTFEQWVARSALANANAIYSYEYNCLTIFQAAKAQELACIYDVPSPEHDFVEDLLYQEQQHYPELDSPYRQYCRARQAQRTEHRRREWHLADVVIANSEFTKASYAAAGLDVTKVRVVPYGAPPINEEAIHHLNSHNPVKFLWAGTFSIRKGAHYLLQAWKQLNATSNAQLDVFGAMALPNTLLQYLPDSIHISGTIPRADLYQQYHNADVLVFPTLCDGFGMVVTEAFAQGLPVITTDRAGAADLVRHGHNGLIVPARDATALKDALEWCITHRAELHAMRQAALETAAQWQWSDYRRALIESLLDGLNAAGFHP